jgi:capsule polysaccharide export protein KpsE/RkpR
MKIAVAILQQWHRENPDRLLQAALSQAERLAQMAPELEALRAQNASLHQQLEVKAKRIAQLEGIRLSNCTVIPSPEFGG